MLTKDKFGDKVIRLSDNRIAKLFRLKSIFSSALVWPYSRRFVRAVKLLEKRNIPTIKITDTYKVPSITRDMVLYEPLEGMSLRDLILSDKSNPAPVLNFALFFAHLHNCGIYFRAIHFNNVISMLNGKFGLIDVTDLYTSLSFSLSWSKRVRNFKHILRYKEDRQAIAFVSLERFLDHYMKKADFKSEKDSLKFRKKVLKLYGTRLKE